MLGFMAGIDARVEEQEAMYEELDNFDHKLGLYEDYKLLDDHEEPPPMGEVDVDRRTVDELLIALAHVTRKSAKAQEAIDAEDARVAQWRHENVRRRHDYAPFVAAYLKKLAERGDLMQKIDEAKKKQRQR